MSEVFDLEALMAPAEPLRFTYHGEEWVLPPSVPVEALYLGSGVEMLLLLIDDGAEGQKERFLALRPRPDVRALKALEELTTKHYGVTLGESLASATSSANTGDQSRPTSSGSTDETSPSTPDRADSADS